MSDPDRPGDERVAVLAERKAAADPGSLEHMFLRLRGAQDSELREQIVGEILQLLVAFSSAQATIEEELACKISDEGLALISEGKLGTWLDLLSSLHDRGLESHSLGIVKVCQHILDTIGTECHIDAVMAEFEKDSPPPLSLLEKYLLLVPGSALYELCRRDFWQTSDELEDMALQFMQEAAANQPRMMVRLARDPRPEPAGMVVRVLASLSPGLVRRVLVQLHLHPDPEVRLQLLRVVDSLPQNVQVGAAAPMLQDSEPEIRIVAAEFLGECQIQNATRALLKATADPKFAEQSDIERVAFWVALARSNEPDALRRVEKVLRPPPPAGLLDRLKRRLSGDAVDTAQLQLVEELARIGRPEVDDLLRKGARSSNRTLAQACEEALERD